SQRAGERDVEVLRSTARASQRARESRARHHTTRRAGRSRADLARAPQSRAQRDRCDARGRDAHTAHLRAARRRTPRSFRHRAGPPPRGVRAPLHAVLHHQNAWHRFGPRDRPIGSERSRRKNLGREREGQRRDVPHRLASELTMARLLIVDDDQNTLAALSRAFRMEGHEATVCDNASRALDLIKSQTFDIMLSDVVMPGKDGLALLEDVRNLGVTLPVVMISGQANIEMAVRATRLGAVDFLEKPLSTDKLLLTIDNVLKL